MTDETARPAVLVSLLTGKKSDVDHARRLIGHRRLVLLAHPGTTELARAVQESEGGDIAHIIGFDESDALTQLQRIRTVLQEESLRAGKVPRFVLNAAGGDPQLVLAMIMLAYEEGHETWFIQEGRHERLPILKGVQIHNRLEEDEATVLGSIPPEGVASSELAPRIVIPRQRVETVFRTLEKKDLVELYAQEARVAARPTSTGTYLQESLRRP